MPQTKTRLFTWLIPFVILLLLALTALPSHASSSISPGTIRGAVLDGSTRNPVANANVVVVGTEFGSSTNLDGRFIIHQLPPGTYNVVATVLGYKGESRSEVVVLPGKAVDVEFLLEPAAITGEEVVVRGSYFKPSPNLPTSTRSLRYEEIRRAPGSAEDVQRAVQALPGVFSRNDQNNEIIVRGGSPFENLTIIDGIEIENINHFPDQSSSGGPICAVNSEFLREVTFSTGGYSARYGDKLSSILNLELREGDVDAFNGQLELSMAGAGANVEGSLPGGEGSYLASFRKSYLDLIHGAIGLTAIPHYWDAQFKVARQLSSRAHLSLIGLYGRDQISIEAEDPDAWSRGAESFDARGYNFTFGGRARLLLANSFLELVLGRSEAWYSYDVYEVERDPSDNSLSQRQFYFNRSTETTDQMHVVWTGKHRNINEISAGISVKPLTFDHNIWAEPDTTSYDFNNDGITDTTIIGDPWRVEESTTSLKYGAFLQYRLRATQNLSLIGGLRLDGFTYSDQQVVDPRLSLRWELLPKMTLTLSWGIYHQSHPLVVYTSDPANNTLPHMRAVHYIAGVSHLLSNSTKISLEGYYKDYHNLPVSEESLMNNLDPLFRSFRTLAIGTKNAYGLEFFAQQKMEKNWYGTFSYSFGKARTSNSIDEFPADYDFQHVSTLVLGYTFSGVPIRDFQRKWYGKWTVVLPVNGDELTASTRFRYVSGRPYTPRFWTDSGPEIDYHWVKSNAENSARYPAYSRWDVRWDSKWFFGRSAIVMFLEIENVLDRPNVAEYIYADDGEINTVHQFRFFFVGGFRFEW